MPHDAAVTVKHGTSSVFVFCRVRERWRIGLVRHPRLGREMIPGGHVEPGESPGKAAVREVAEETGLAVTLLDPPAAPLPGGCTPVRVAQPWWIFEYRVPPDGTLAVPHVHIDYLYTAVADDPQPATEPAHPFGWYSAADLPGLHMFPDARTLATVMLEGLAAGQMRSPAGGVGSGGNHHECAAAVLARLREAE